MARASTSTSARSTPATERLTTPTPVKIPIKAGISDFDRVDPRPPGFDRLLPRSLPQDRTSLIGLRSVSGSPRAPGSPSREPPQRASAPGQTAHRHMPACSWRTKAAARWWRGTESARPPMARSMRPWVEWWPTRMTSRPSKATRCRTHHERRRQPGHEGWSREPVHSTQAMLTRPATFMPRPAMVNSVRV